MKKLFSVVLVALLIITGSFTAVYAESNDDGSNTGDNSFESWVQDIDPSTLDIHYPGEDLVNEEDEEPRPVYDDSDVVRVSIVLDKPATLDIYSAEDVADNAEAIAYRESLQDEQNDITKAIENKINSELDVQWNLTLAANIISANVEYGDIETIKKVEGVEDVFVETRYEVLDDEINTAVTTEYMVNVTAAWAQGYTGAGSRVAIIDTGTNQDHISFDPEAFEYALTKDGKSLDDYNLLTKAEINSVLEQLNLNNATSKYDIESAEEVYKNSKIPFAFNYVDGNTVTDHDSDNQGEHGSHVAGITAANRYVKVNGEFVDAAKEVGAVGTAPDAQILTMKVFGQGGGAYDSDYFAAIEDAIILKADSINLSLGSSNPGFSFAGAYQGIMDGLVETNSTVVISAGNSYNWTYAASNIQIDEKTFYGQLYLDDVSEDTVGSPASFTNSLSIAAAENVGVVGRPLKYNGKEIFYTETSSRAAEKNQAEDEI